MSDLSFRTSVPIREVFELPTTIPSCIVKIQDFDDEGTLQENIRDYVITDTVAAEMERLMDRVVASCVRHEAGEGHYLHGSFGSGKSHFMAILGLILENNPAIWTKDHPAIRAIQERHGVWLAEHPLLVVPVYMLGQATLQAACYNAANQRLEKLGKPPCEFSDADKVIASFRADARRYGEVVFRQFQEATGISQTRFDKLAAGDQESRDNLARRVLAYRDPSRTERVQLYPDKFSDGMAALTRHAQAHGFYGVTFLVDELILYLTGKAGREYLDEFNDLVALADNSALDRAVPLWVIVAKQRNIAETVPDDTSQQHVHDAMEHHKDRFPETTELADTELVPIVQERVLRVRTGMGKPLQKAIDETLSALSKDVRETLLHDLTPEDFRHVHPFHPALIRTLIDVSARLSRERAAIRLLYELLIVRHPELPIGSLVPYASLFDAVFLPEGLAGGSRNEELAAVHQTYYERLAPLINDLYGQSEQARRADLIVKTVLLCGLSRTMRDAVTVERVLHLNYEDLRGRTPFGSYQAIAQVLADLDNRSELVSFTPNATNPALGVVSITLASGAQLSDVLKRVPVNWRQRLDAFTGLIKELLGKPIQNSEIPNYERLWRGSRRRGRVRFANVAELSLNDMTVANGDVFTLFIDYPFDLSAPIGSAVAVTYTQADDQKVIERALTRLPPVPVGFWLPAEFTADDLRDLEDYARMLEVEASPHQYLEEYGRTQRQELETQLVSQRRTKARVLRDRLLNLYKGPGSSVRFLDPSITPSLDVETMELALDRIADAVCDRLHPHHPRFPIEANQRALRRLLEDFLVPAALGNGSVPRNPELDGWLTRLGEPLELAERGAQNWTLRPHSRYLNKLEELATGKRVEADKVRRGLVEAFGFNRDLCDTFLLYLIRGRGYRALRGPQPVADVDYGALEGLVLERGERLAVHEWAQVKEFIQNTWGIRPPTTELTVAAQDQLWRQLNAAARGIRNELDRARQQLSKALIVALVPLDQAPRLAVLDAAIAFNFEAMREDIDPYDGLKMLLNWQPDQPNATREKAADQIARRMRTLNALYDLQTDTLERIVTLAQGENMEAQSAWEEVRKFLAAPDDEADLYSHGVSWSQRANQTINAALKAQVGRRVDLPDSGVTETKGKERRVRLRVSSARLEVGAEIHELNREQVEQSVLPLLPQVLDPTESAETEVTIRLVIAPEKNDG
jgi:hypothetical protein